ncbi:restriction endonuclease [Polyangium jinanense]|uniref:restriction endonuclease n=1 Tax=Polyangium jinanense TaxID=2829994 RepID=UPI002341A106|nr:restriction endonuclease [Polyangium jinanense]
MFDGLGYYIRYAGVGYRHGIDAVVARLRGSDVENCVFEAKCGQANEPAAVKQVQGYLADFGATVGLVVNNRDLKAKTGGAVEFWGLDQIVDVMMGRRIGMNPGGDIDDCFFRDLLTYFGGA